VRRAPIPFAAVATAILTLAACTDKPDTAMDETNPTPPAAATTPTAATAATRLNVPVDYHKLDNGLKVVISEDHTVPIATVGVYYHIGFRIEPRGRTL